MIGCLFARKWQTIIWNWVVSSRRVFVIWLRSCHFGICLLCFLCCLLCKVLIFIFLRFLGFFLIFAIHFCFLTFSLSMKPLDFSFNFFRRSLHFWALIKPKYSSSLGSPETLIYKASAMNCLNGLRGGPTMVAQRRKCLRFKRLKRPNTYIFASLEGHLEVENILTFSVEEKIKWL